MSSNERQDSYYYAHDSFTTRWVFEIYYKMTQAVGDMIYSLQIPRN